MYNISDTAFERDEIDAKIFDPDQVREILDELTNLEINNKNEVSFRWKKPLKHLSNNASTEEFRFGARDRTWTCTPFGICS